MSMSNSNQKQLLMSLADCWRSTNASWLCSKKPMFFSVSAAYFVSGSIAAMLLSVLFLNPNTVHWGSLCICTEFFTLMKFLSYWMSKKKKISYNHVSNECHVLCTPAQHSNYDFQNRSYFQNSICVKHDKQDE